MNWHFPTIYDYLDQLQDAIYIQSRKLADLPEEEQTRELLAIQSAILDQAKGFSDEDMVRVAYVMTEDLYKAANRESVMLDNALYNYVQASAGTFFELLSQRGFVVHYLIDNTFDPTLEGMQRPLKLYDTWFRAAGFVYICPQHIAYQLMEKGGHDVTKSFDLLPRHMGTSREIANEIVGHCHKEQRHYVFLDTDWIPTSFDTSNSVVNQPYVTTIFRTDPPFPHSRSLVYCQDRDGRSLVDGLRTG